MRVELRIEGGGEVQLREAVVCVLDDRRRQQAEGKLKGLRRVVELADSLASVTLEFWASCSHLQPDILQFVASASIDLAEWSRMGRPTRQYPLSGSKRQGSIGPEASGIASLTKQQVPPRQQVCIRSLDDKHRKPSEAATATKKPSPATSRPRTSPHDSGRRYQSMHKDIQSTSAFFFQTPTIPVARSRRFREARIGQIVRERRTDLIEALIPITPFAVTTPTPENQPATGKKSTERIAALRKALMLLQFSCQYTVHCVHTLDDHSRNLVRCHEKAMERVERLKQRSRRLKESAATLRSESQSASSSLDALRSLLQELDSEALTKLQSDLE